MNLPLVLTGPILRRVEPTLVSVWVALRDPCRVRLNVWEGRVGGPESGRPDVFLESPATSSLRVGDKLHMAEVTIQIPATSGKSLQADALYSYDLEITTDSGGVHTHTLASLGMLEDGKADRDTDGDAKGNRRLALGMEAGLLPSFAPPPSDLENLNLLYGSCRRPGQEGPDALAMVDDLIFDEDLYKDPRARPHQLFLGGDQIYADDVTPLHMLLVMKLAKHLIGVIPGTPPLEGDGIVPVEHVRLDQILKLATIVDPSNPVAAYIPEDSEDNAGPDLPVDREHFPEERRLSVTLRDAQFTSGDGKSHVISLGEFAALYLTVWSSALWGAEIPDVRFALDPGRPQVNRAIRWDEELPEDGLILMPEVVFPRRIAAQFYVAPKEPPKRQTDEEKAEADRKRQLSLRRGFKILQDFHKGLPKVQRALANVPTYMIFDDHDATDDYFLNPMWRDRVLRKQLGQAILRNAMVAYALFQDWGNDPLKYLTGPQAQLLSLVPQLFPAGLAKGPVQEVCDRIAHLLGHDLRNTPTADGRYASVTPPILWHFTIDGPKHRVIALDNRTRRSYGSRNGPPGNVSIDAMVDQIPLPPLPAGQEILIVVAPLQVIGPPVLDDLVAPLSYRGFDLGGLSSESNLAPTSTTGLREMVGTNPDAIEAWAFDAVTFEHLLERLEPYRRVVLLSGDVHYSGGSLMSYWRGDAVQPARFAQFTSSGLKNVMPADKVTFVDRAAGFAQQLVRANLGAERIAWDQPLDDLVLLPAGTSQIDLVPVMRARLQSVPVLIPTWGWPDLNEQGSPNPDPVLTTRLNPDLPPDWRWRVRPLRDERRESRRPDSIRLLAIDDDAVDQNLANPDTVLEQYQAIAMRHQHALGRLRNARQILFRSNVGRVRFLSHDGQLDAIHEVYTTFTDPDQPAALEPKPEPFMVQVASLGPENEAPPARLRQRAIDIPRAGIA